MGVSIAHDLIQLLVRLIGSKRIRSDIPPQDGFQLRLRRFRLRLDDDLLLRLRVYEGRLPMSVFFWHGKEKE
jgi:hypothetical protein